MDGKQCVQIVIIPTNCTLIVNAGSSKTQDRPNYLILVLVLNGSPKCIGMLYFSQ